MNDMRMNCQMRHESGNCMAAGGFCTAVSDPICEAALHNAYFQGGYDATEQIANAMNHRGWLKQPAKEGE